ncbi:hypothetical protein ACHAXT_005482 [Thalassiosira profunda]
MTSLGDKLVHLSLEIEDRKKSSELLRRLINDQGMRHADEHAAYQQTQEAVLQKLTAESKESRSEIARVVESLAHKKSALEARLNEVVAQKKAAEAAKKKNLDAVRRETQENKEAALAQHKQERAEREKVWYDGRVADIHRLTWKGIQPNIDRLTRKHREQCEEIRSKAAFAKQKLELQCENELAERIQAFERSEQQSNACITQRSEFATVLLREQNEHAASLAKLKEKLAADEESAKKMYALQLETLAKENDAALAKVCGSKRVQQLTHELAAKKDARRVELDAELQRVEKDVNASKQGWEASWLKASVARMEKKNKQQKEELMQWRKEQIDGLIRQSILDQAECNSSPDNTLAGLTAAHEEKVAAFKESLEKQKTAAEETRANISRIEARKAKLSMSVESLQEELDVVGSQLDDITNTIDRKRRQQKARVEEHTKGVEEKLSLIARRRGDIEQEIADAQEKIKEDQCKHRAEKDRAIAEHEQKLGELQSYAAEAAGELDSKARRIQQSSKDQQQYLSRAKKLLSTRYKAKPK